MVGNGVCGKSNEEGRRKFSGNGGGGGGGGGGRGVGGRGVGGVGRACEAQHLPNHS